MPNGGFRTPGHACAGHFQAILLLVHINHIPAPFEP
jgi:hypothetical protein